MGTVVSAVLNFEFIRKYHNRYILALLVHYLMKQFLLILGMLCILLLSCARPVCDDHDYCTEDSYNITSRQCTYSAIPTLQTTERSAKDPSNPIPALNILFNAMVNHDTRTEHCFFGNVTDTSLQQYVNLSKDFSEYQFLATSYTPSNVVTSVVTDPDFRAYTVYFYMRRSGDFWRVVKIDGNNSVLK
jgi:hypothetical protein